MHPESIERLLNAVIEGDVPSLWQLFARESGTQDIDRFVIWLEARGEIDAETARTLLLAERLDVSGGSTATFAEGSGGTVPELPSEAGGHTVLSTLGAGAMGEVFLVRDEALRRKVALKKVTRRAVNNPTLLARFLTEAQVTAQLEHPSIIPVYGFERDKDGVPSYTMKLIQGTTFKDFLKECRAFYERGETPDAEHCLDTGLEHFLKVCDAMAFAHDRDVLHRDLKPANIMIGAFGEVVVMDWGVARVRGDDGDKLETLTGLAPVGGAQLTRLGQAIGTPAFMSPEQALGENERLDGRSDLYSLGLILYEVVTLERAYTGISPMAVLTNAQEGKVAPVVAKLAGLSVPRELAGVVRKATRVRPSERYPNVAAMAEDIRRYLRGEAVLAVRDTALQRIARWLSGHRQLTAFAAIALVLLSATSVLGGVASVQLERAEAREQQVRLSHLLGAVGGHAHGVDAQLLRYTALLESLGATARARLVSPVDPEEPLFLNEAFAEGGAAPSDAFFSERYRQKVSFEQPVLKLAPGVTREAVGTRLGQLAGVRTAFRELFLRSHDDASARLSRVQADALLRSGNAPVVWAYVAVEEGVHSSFPGHGPYPEAYDPRVRPWYLAAVLQDGPHWGAPYVDINGLGLILPCNLTLRDSAGELLGVAGLELTVGRVIRELLDPADIQGAEEAFLLDREGKIVVSSLHSGKRAAQDEDLSKAAELEAFSEDAVAAAVEASASGSLAVGGELYTWTRLVTIDWTYVARGPAKAMLD